MFKMEGEEREEPFERVKWLKKKDKMAGLTDRGDILKDGFQLQ